jgi:hypothetical protein
MSESVWLRHAGLPGEDGHGGAFLCPAGAVADWLAMGWELGDPPEEPNPVVAENIAAQKAAAEQAKAEAAAEKKATTKKTRHENDTETREG